MTTAQRQDLIHCADCGAPCAPGARQRRATCHRRRMAERVQQIAELASKGLTDAQIADRTGSTHAAVCRMRLRHNIPPGVPPGRNAPVTSTPPPRRSEPQPVHALTYDEESQALCAQADGDAWFPERGQSSRLARQICLDCPIGPRRDDAGKPILGTGRCYEVARANGERDGVWGAVSFAHGLQPRRIEGAA